MLGAAYWREVERLTRGIVRTRSRGSGMELRVARFGPTLLRFGPPQLSVTTDAVSTTYPITGGMLARRAAGSITLSMHGGAGRVELRSAIAGYHPTLAARPGAPALLAAQRADDPDAQSRRRRRPDPLVARHVRDAGSSDGRSPADQAAADGIRAVASRSDLEGW